METKRDLKTETLDYHAKKPAGKIAVVPTKACNSAKELSLAYTPGVAFPCLDIEKDPALAYQYTAKGNLVAVASNGTAVLGLGDIGALAGKPVMEGKGILFKRFANVNVFDIEIKEKDPHKLIEVIAALEPTFGGINLEDIKAPECFQVEEELIQRMNIPVFHDDQHGTAIIASAGLLNALEIFKKKIQNVKIVFSGAGAAAISCANLFLELGVNLKNIYMFDSVGLINTARKAELNKYKIKFMQNQELTLEEALTGADVFVGLSKADILTAKMIQKMALHPVVFAMANPNPEISYPEGKAAVAEIIMATGRSDYPNQVNNVLGFPFIFRAALDTLSTKINLSMKLAAVKALAALAHQPVPVSVTQAYGQEFKFGLDYIIPKPFDPRVLYHVAPAVAQAAMDSGVARKKIDIVKYTEELKVLSEKLSKGEFV